MKETKFEVGDLVKRKYGKKGIGIIIEVVSTDVYKMTDYVSWISGTNLILLSKGKVKK